MIQFRSTKKNVSLLREESLSALTFFIVGTLSLLNWNFKMLVLEEGGKSENL